MGVIQKQVLLENEISMAQRKTAVTPVRQQWCYRSLALSHRYIHNSQFNERSLSITHPSWGLDYKEISMLEAIS